MLLFFEVALSLGYLFTLALVVKRLRAYNAARAAFDHRAEGRKAAHLERRLPILELTP